MVSPVFLPFHAGSITSFKGLSKNDFSPLRRGWRTALVRTLDGAAEIPVDFLLGSGYHETPDSTLKDGDERVRIVAWGRTPVSPVGRPRFLIGVFFVRRARGRRPRQNAGAETPGGKAQQGARQEAWQGLAEPSFGPMLLPR